MKFRTPFTAVLGAVWLSLSQLVAANPLPELSQVEQISAGATHACAVTGRGEVYCWGDNARGQLGDGTTRSRPLPAKVVGLNKPIQAVAAGRLHTCALSRDSEVFCWGSNSAYEVGDGTRALRLLPVRVLGVGTETVAIAAGGNHSCALDRQGVVRCWGIFLPDQSATGGPGGNYPTPFPIAGLAGPVKAVAAGAVHTCVLYQGGELACFGSFGSSGIDDVRYETPSPVPGLNGKYKSVSGGEGFVCAVTEAGAVFCHGHRSNGRLGNGQVSGIGLVTAAVQGLSERGVSVATGGDHACSVLSDGGLRCWGRNSPPGASVHTGGQLGDGTRLDRSTPIAVTMLDSKIKQAAAGKDFTCALTVQGTVRCWGGGYFDEAGDGVGVRRHTPRAVAGDLRFEQASLGSHHTCGIDRSGNVYCWGRNEFGQLGDGTSVDRKRPTQVADLSGRWVSVATGSRHSCAVSEAGAVKCWGVNFSGQVGDGTLTARSRPVSVVGLESNVVQVTAGNSHTCARLRDGSLYCWGDNSDGQLGDGTREDRTTPVQPMGLPALNAAFAGGFHTCGVSPSGVLYCWGANSYGQLGTGTTERQLLPIQVSIGSPVKSIAGGGFHTCALSVSGQAFCFGENLFGGLAVGSSERRILNPMPVLGLETNLKSIVGGSSSTCAVSANDAVFCWGNHPSIGDGSDLSRSTPVAVSGLGSSVASVANGAFLHSCVVMLDGRVQCWGDGTFGQVGDDGRDITLPAPVRVDEKQAEIRSAASQANGPVLLDAYGKYLVYETSEAIGNEDRNASSDIVRRLRAGGPPTRVSLADDESEISAASIEPAISADGELIAFVAPDSAVGKLAGESAKAAAGRRTSTGFSVFLRNMQTGSTRLVGQALPGGVGTKPTIAPDGNAIAFTSLPTADIGVVDQSNVFVVQLQRVGAERVPSAMSCASCKSGTTNSNGNSSHPSLSADGTWLAFQTTATNLAPGTPTCSTQTSNILLLSMQTSQSRLVSNASASGACLGGGATKPSIDWSGVRVAFQTSQSVDTNDRNGVGDVYVFDADSNATTRASVDPLTGHDGLGDSQSAVISGNGRVVVFQSSAKNIESSEPDSNEATDVFARNIETGALRRVSRNAVGELGNAPSATPSVDYAGLQVAFASNASNLLMGQQVGTNATYLTGTSVAPSSKTGTWWNPSESGWGLTTVDQGNVIAFGWFTYDVDGEPTWFVGAVAAQADGSYAGTAYRSTGVPIERISGPAANTTDPVAQVSMRFSGSGALVFSYSLPSGQQQSKAMRRFLFGSDDVACRDSPSLSRANVDNLSDVWWGGSDTPGWGVFVFHVRDTLYAFWYSYDTDGEALFLIAVATKQADGMFRGDLFRQLNGVPFTQIDGAPPSPGADVIGSAQFDPSNGDLMEFAYSLNGVTQIKQISRLVFGQRPGQCSG